MMQLGTYGSSVDLSAALRTRDLNVVVGSSPLLCIPHPPILPGRSLKNAGFDDFETDLGTLSSGRPAWPHKGPKGLGRVGLISHPGARHAKLKATKTFSLVLACATARQDEHGFGAI